MRSTTLAALLAATAMSPAFAQQDEKTQEPLAPVTDQLSDPKSANVAVRGHVLEPEQIAPNAERIGRLNLPEGFEITLWAENLANPRMIDVADDGTVYVTRRAVGDVMMLRDANGDGTVDETESERRVVASRPMMHGIEIDGDDVWLTTVAEVFRTTRRADGTLEPLKRIVDDLPEGGQHPNRMVQMGPDGMLYVSVGSTCNACGETNPENATMLRMAPDGSSRTIFASGLRNTIGYGFVPGSGELYGMDHGIDWLGDNEQHEELNHLVRGASYGWPYVFDDGKFNPQDYPPNGITMEEWAELSTDPVGLYVPHAAPMQLAFYTGDAFPENYRGDAFVAMRGSWNRNPPSGYEVLRIDFEDGRPVAFEPFVTGFLMEDEASGSGWGQMGRLAGLAAAPDGALYLSDDTNGVIYRIAHTGEGATGQGATGEGPVITNEEGAEVRILDAAMATPPSTTEGLAIDLLGDDVPILDVISAAFEAGGALPDVHAAEGGNVSPPLAWGAGPEGTASFAVLVDDPDVSENPPFAHWILWNLPAETRSLPEGLPGAPRLLQPEGAMQGANDRGSIGYFGPRPPVGDPAHAYHFQIFALDKMLDLSPGASRTEVIDAMRGHVLAEGEIVGTYQRTQP